MFKNKKKKDNTKIRTSSFKLKSIPVRENGDNYYYIENFEQATEKQCKEYDKLNQLIFQKYNGIYDKISNKLDDCPFKLDKKPDPPKSPNNYESLIKWRAMNSLKNVSQQTIATLYLLKHSFNISLDFNKDGIKPSEIIDVALKETNNDLEFMKQEGYDFLATIKKETEKETEKSNTNKNTNIRNFRSKSKQIGNVSGCSRTDNLSSSSSSIEIDFGFNNSNYHKQIQPHTHTHTHTNNNQTNNNQTNNNQTNNNHTNNNHTNNNHIEKQISNVNLHMVHPNQYNNQPKEQPIQQSQQQTPYHNVQMKCERPEHHTMNEKVGHFNNLYPTINTPDYNPNHNPNHNPNGGFPPKVAASAPFSPPDYNG